MVEASAVREKALLRFYSYMVIEFENSWSLRVPEVGVSAFLSTLSGSVVNDDE